MKDENNLINEYAKLGNQNQELKQLIIDIEERMDSIERDLHEPDKVLCHLGWIKREISKVYPKYQRKEE